MCVCVMCGVSSEIPEKPKERIGTPGAEIADGFDLLSMGGGVKLCPSDKEVSFCKRWATFAEHILYEVFEV